MLDVILGENTYLRASELANIKDKLKIIPEYIDVDKITTDILSEIIMGGTLFSNKRLIVIYGLSDNKGIFEKFVGLAKNITPDNTIVLIEPKLDKRTKTYKELVKIAKITVVDPIFERNQEYAVTWLEGVAKKSGLKLSKPLARTMVKRAIVDDGAGGGVYVDQTMLANAMNSLVGTKEVFLEHIDTILPISEYESVFNILNVAIYREIPRLEKAIKLLERTGDPHKILALIFSQWSQIALISVFSGTDEAMSKLGIHPYAVKQNVILLNELNKGEIKKITIKLAQLDVDCKNYNINAWQIIYQALYLIANR